MKLANPVLRSASGRWRVVAPQLMGRSVRAQLRHSARQLGLVAILPVVGCGIVGTGEFVDFEDFDEIPTIGMLDYSSVHPARAYDLWELRESFEGVAAEIIGTGGAVGRGGLDPDLLREFDCVDVGSGFGNYCLPGNCFRFIASLRERTVDVWQNAEDVRSFIGSIDTQEDAVLLVLAHGYIWGTEKDGAAIRTVGARYELVVLRMVSFCTPVQTDRYLLQVTQDGQVIELKSEVWERQDGCI